MRIGERGFRPALQPVILDFNDWRATYRWPFIALCLILSLGVIASGGAKYADAGQLGETAKTPAAIQAGAIPQNAGLHSVDAENPAAAIGIQTSPIAPQQTGNEQVQR